MASAERHANVTVFGVIEVDKDASTFIDVASVPPDDYCRGITHIFGIFLRKI